MGWWSWVGPILALVCFGVAWLCVLQFIEADRENRER